MRLTLRHGLAAAASLTLLAAMSACSTADLPDVGGAASPDVATNDELAAALPAAVADRGDLRVGVALGTPPSAFEDENSEVVGYEIDLITALAETLGLEVALEPLSFDSLIPSLEADRIDVAIGDLGAKTERQEVIDQVGWLWGNQLFAALADSDLKVESLDDLCGKSVAVNRGSRQADFAEEQQPKCLAAGQPEIDVQIFQNGPQATDSMMNGRSDLVWQGSTSIRYFVAQTEGLAEVVGQYSEPNYVTVGLQKDSELSPIVRDALQEMIDNGDYDTILGEWGLEEQAVDIAELNVVPGA